MAAGAALALGLTASPALAQAPTPEAGASAAARIGSTPAAYRATAPNDTLWTIARAVAPAGVSPNQVMVAIARRNPTAFIGHNMFFMRVGVPLQLPTLDEVRAEDAAEAVAIVETHRGQWRAGRATATPLASPTAAAATAPTRAPAPTLPAAPAPLASAPVTGQAPAVAAPPPVASAPTQPPVAAVPETPAPPAAVTAAPPAAPAPSPAPSREQPAATETPPRGLSPGALLAIAALAAAGLGAAVVLRQRRRAGPASPAAAEAGADGAAGRPRSSSTRDDGAGYATEAPAPSALHRRPSAPPVAPPLVQWLGDLPPLPSAAVDPEPALELLVGKAYLDVGDSEEARKWLRLVVEHGDEEQRQEAAQLLG